MNKHQAIALSVATPTVDFHWDIKFFMIAFGLKFHLLMDNGVKF